MKVKSDGEIEHWGVYKDCKKCLTLKRIFGEGLRHLFKQHHHDLALRVSECCAAALIPLLIDGVECFEQRLTTFGQVQVFVTALSCFFQELARRQTRQQL